MNKLNSEDIEKAFNCNCRCHIIGDKGFYDCWVQCCILSGHKFKGSEKSLYKELFDFSLETVEQYSNFRQTNHRNMTKDELSEFELKRHEAKKILMKKMEIEYNESI